MGYESEPLPSYPDIRNCSYSPKLITPLPRLYLWIIYQVLIPLAHHLHGPLHPLRLHAQFIHMPTGHPLRYVRLPPLYVYSYGVEPCRVHRLLYNWILPLSSGPTFRHHPRDPLHCPMVERCQDLDHLPVHHPTIAYIE